MNNLVHIGAVVYGLALAAGAFMRHPLTEALRVDALFLPVASEKTRPLNLIFGALVAGYGAWSLWGLR
jgi:hypothetical protein